MKLSLSFLIAIAAPLIALYVVWGEPLSVASISAGRSLPGKIQDELRFLPGDHVLRELREVAVSYPRFDSMERSQLLGIANEVLDRSYVDDASGHRMSVPFEPGSYLFGQSGWHLDLHSFSIPSLLSRAYEVSGESIYIQEAVDYVLDWANFEARLLVPRGYFFNDHATAARSIVVTEVWRQYRASDAYDADAAAGILSYVQKLMSMLADERLYEYRSNHGIMQNLSLLHLSIAFPSLKPSLSSWTVGRTRLLSQLEYYINKEGVILEHSPGYHHNGLRRLAAAWRYFGLKGEPVPEDFFVRYQKALEFQTALYRPDRTLPPVGDTGDYTYTPIDVAMFDEDLVATSIRDAPPTSAGPDAVTAAPGAGWIILWDGLEHWPEQAKLTQTAVHWGNFPTQAHKHADELSISIWSGGSQWIRGVGYWPYGKSRSEATGWRSSNGPHWSGESAADERHSTLAGTVLDDAFSFVHMIRTIEGGERISRQVAKIRGNSWIILDSFQSNAPNSAEVVWRLSPDIVLSQPANDELLLVPKQGSQTMQVLIDGSSSVEVDPDFTGTSPWNGGLLAGGRIGTSPAVRVTSSGENVAILTIIRLYGGDGGREKDLQTHLQWNDATQWKIAVTSGGFPDIAIARSADSIHLTTGSNERRRFEISTEIAEAAALPRDSALQALARNSQRHDEPFRAKLQQRTKMTLVISILGAVHLILLFVVTRKKSRLILPLTASSAVAWLGLSLFLKLHYFA